MFLFIFISKKHGQKTIPNSPEVHPGLIHLLNLYSLCFNYAGQGPLLLKNMSSQYTLDQPTGL